MITSRPFVSDNPFRLCGVGSATTLKQLRQVAIGAVQRANVGLPGKVGWSDIFGADEVAQCASIVRSLVNDPTRLTIFRILWPLAYTESMHERSGEAFSNFKAHLKTSGLQGTFYATQMRFLLSWYGFLLEPDVTDLSKALLDFDQLYSDPSCDDFLLRLLDLDSFPDAEAILHDAHAKTKQYLLNTACQAAIEKWQSGQTKIAISLIRCVKICTFDEHSIDRALLKLTSVGDTEQTQLEQMRDDLPAWTPDRGTTDFDAARPLAELSDLLLGHVPAARDWKEATDVYCETVLVAMRDHAIDAVNDRNDWQTAYVCLKQLLDAPMSRVYQDRVRQDLDTLHGVMHGIAVECRDKTAEFQKARHILNLILQDSNAGTWHSRCQADLDGVKIAEELHAERILFSDIRPIKRLPDLKTMNLTGVILYGRSPMLGRQKRYFTTAYLCLVGIPIFPLTRYLVSDAQPKGWNFHGVGHLTKANKIHTIFSWLLIVSFVFYLSFHGTSGTDSQPESTPTPIMAQPETTQSSDTSIVPDAAQSSSPQIADGATSRSASEHHANLVAEANDLIDKINAESADLAKAAAKIENDRATLKFVTSETELVRSGLDRYDVAAVRKFNSNVDENRSLEAKFNRTVKKYNARIEVQNQRRIRLQEIKNALNESTN